MTNRQSAPKSFVKKGCLVLLLLPILLLLLITLVADYLNIPLIPLDLIRPMVRLELKCQVEEFTPQELAARLGSTTGVKVFILKASGEAFHDRSEGRYETDAEGRMKIFLPRGAYRLRAELDILQNSRLSHYRIPSADTTLPFEAKSDTTTLEVVLREVAEPDLAKIVGAITESIRRGAVGEAEALTQQALSSDARTSDDPAVIARLNNFETSLSLIIDQLTAFSQLPLASYTSRLKSLQAIDALLTKLAPDLRSEDRQVIWGGEHLSLRAQINGLIQVRERIIETNLTNFKLFKTGKQYDGALEIWLRIVNDQELFPGVEQLNDSLAGTIADLEANELADIIEKVRSQLMTQVQTAQQHYLDGELDESWKTFGLVKRRIILFGSILDLPETLSEEVDSYLDDIVTLTQANKAYSERKRDAALALYSKLRNPNQAAIMRIASLEGEFE